MNRRKATAYKKGANISQYRLSTPLHTQASKLEETIFSQDVINIISRRITRDMEPFEEMADQDRDPRDEPRSIAVSDSNIRDILHTVYRNNQRGHGSIHTKYIVPPRQSGATDLFQNIIDETVSLITRDLETQLKKRYSTSRLSKWNSVLGAQNPMGLNPHQTIKLNDRSIPRGVVMFRTY